MNKAVFLDRDGVLNELIWNPQTNAYESPHVIGDFKLFAYVAESLRCLQAAGFCLFVISNQPSYAKGKTSLENIKEIQAALEQELHEAGVNLTASFYCYHHPEGIVPEYRCECQCRKPGNAFLVQAATTYSIDLTQSWLIGDQDSDIFCGQSCQMKTVLLNNEHSAAKRGRSEADYIAGDLQEAVQIIMGSL